MLVEQVVNLSEKSFKNYTGPDPKFKEKNIIFGYNGRGKSSLAKGIVNEFLKDTSNKMENLRFFNRTFINRNLELKESENPKIKGVVASFGEKDVDIEKQIAILNSQIVDTKEYEKDLNVLNKSVRDEINRIHDSKKGKVNIAKKPSLKTNEDVIKLYLEDLKIAKKIESDEEKLKELRGDNSIEKEKNKIEKINIPELQFLEDCELDMIKEIFNKCYDDIEIPSSLVVDWIENGIKIHNTETRCKFCGNELNLEFIKLKLEKYNSNEKQKASKTLREIYEKICIFNENINKIVDFKIFITEDLECDEAYKLIEDTKNIILELEGDIKKKIFHMENKINFDIELFKHAFDNIYSSYMEILSAKAFKVSKLEEMLIKLNTLIKGSIGLEIINNTFINDTMKKIKEKEDEIKKIVIQNEKCKNKIEELKKSKSNTKDFADHITSVLKDLEINLKLDLYGDNYIIKHSHTSQILKLNEISEGKQNLLSLLYFYYELYEDKEQKKIKNEIKLIIVDDPITSMDDINKMYVLELIKRICEIKNVQIFIFTHVWEDFCDICYKKNDRSDTIFRLLEIKKDNTGSKVVNAPTNESPYQHCFKEIYEFSQKSDANDLTECEIYHYPNIMRKIIEEFLRFKVPNSLPTYSNFGNVKKGLCGDNPSNNDEAKLRTLLDVCNILSHKLSRNPDEILKAAKFLMSKIEVRDKDHYNTMKR